MSLSPECNTQQVLGQLWSEFPGRAGSVPHRSGETMYGIIYGLPEVQRSHPHELQYIAAVQVSQAAGVPEGMVAWTVPAGKFAVFLHRGPIQRIAETCRYIYREWLPASTYEHSEVADVELYDDRFCADSESSEMEYWISIRPK